MIRNSLTLIFVILISCSACFADTIILGAGNESAIYIDPITRPAINDNVTLTQQQLQQYLSSIASNFDQRAYLEALSNRTAVDDKIIDSLKESNKNYQLEIQRRDEKIASLESTVKTSTETLNTKIVEQEAQINNMKWWTIVFIILTFLATIALTEIIQGLTKNKALYFKLKSIRARFPINPAILFPPGDDDK